MVSLLRERALRAAIKWWETRRPVAFTAAEHQANPTINTCTDEEARLARAVSALVRDHWKNDDAAPLVQELLQLVRDLDAGNRISPSVRSKHETLRKAEDFLGLRKDDHGRPRLRAYPDALVVPGMPRTTRRSR